MLWGTSCLPQWSKVMGKLRWFLLAGEGQQARVENGEMGFAGSHASLKSVIWKNICSQPYDAMQHLSLISLLSVQYGNNGFSQGFKGFEPCKVQHASCKFKWTPCFVLPNPVHDGVCQWPCCPWKIRFLSPVWDWQPFARWERRAAHWIEESVCVPAWGYNWSLIHQESSWTLRTIFFDEKKGLSVGQGQEYLVDRESQWWYTRGSSGFVL